MQYDFAKKKKTKRKSRRKSKAPLWIWVFSSLVTCGFVTFLIYLGQLSPAAREAGLVQTDQNSSPVEERHSIAEKTDSAKKEQLTASAEENNKPRFEFYKILSNLKVEVEETAAEVIPKEDYSYILQAGSFRRLEDADRLRARLLLLNMETNIRSANNDSGNTWHRVMVGPFASRSKLSKARSTLINHGINTLKRKNDKVG